MEIGFRFVRMGAVAPDPLPEGEAWLDVGNRAAPRVIDHHAGGTGAWSATALLVERFRDLLLDPLRGREKAELVLHADPDMDAVTAAWIADQTLRTGELPAPRAALDALVREVSANDQGLVRSSQPENCWPIVFRLLLGGEFANLDDAGKLREGLAVLDRSFAALSEGKSLADAAGRILTPATRLVIGQARNDYVEDLSHGFPFQARFPHRSPWAPPETKGAGPLPPPDPKAERWCLADGLYLDEPSSSLFKELARGDEARSPRGCGFPVLIVKRDVRDGRLPGPMSRYILSTDPLSGLHLQGLGRALEAREEALESAAGQPLLPGRERVPPGTGRHGYDVKSPWYDGRGHEFTIIDSPSIQLPDKPPCVSQMASADVLEAVWEYGDPARFVEVLEAEAVWIGPAELQPGWEAEWPQRRTLRELCPDLCEDVKHSLDPEEAGDAVAIRVRPGVAGDPGGPARPSEQQVWSFPDGTALWVGRFAFGAQTADARELCLKLAALRKTDSGTWGPGGAVRLAAGGPLLCVVHCRVRGTGIDLDDRAGADARVLYQLASGRPPTFHNVAEPDELRSAVAVASRDHLCLLYATGLGAAVVSARDVPLREERDFHRPRDFAALAALAAAQKAALDRIALSFARHRSERDPLKAGRLILQDRGDLMRLEQSLAFRQVSSTRFGQKSYEALVSVLGIPEHLEEVKDRIESLSDHVRDVRADFYQTLSFLVTFVFAPLVLATAFFSGIQMDKEFALKNYTIFPGSWQPAGWLLFIAIFLLCSAACGLMWLAARWMARRQGLLSGE